MARIAVLNMVCHEKDTESTTRLVKKHQTVTFPLHLPPRVNVLVNVSQTHPCAQQQLPPLFWLWLMVTVFVSSCLAPLGQRASKSTGVALPPPGSHPSPMATRVARRSLTEGDPGAGTDSSRPAAPPLRCAEIHPNRTRSSLHNDPNESRFAGLNYFKQFAAPAF